MKYKLNQREKENLFEFLSRVGKQIKAALLWDDDVEKSDSAVVLVSHDDEGILVGEICFTISDYRLLTSSHLDDREKTVWVIPRTEIIEGK